ncbi:hypothetical protein [Streptomyces umbrinus]|uniref:hypothetical protein n=1 Tax=Streptomyces umbrinus TaxID=67370 RepID=UPI00344A86FE
MTVEVPDEPPILTPLAAAALLRLISDAARRPADAEGRMPPDGLSTAQDSRHERMPDQ